LKKRTKKLFVLWLGVDRSFVGRPHHSAKVFGSFFQKRTACLLTAKASVIAAKVGGILLPGAPLTALISAYAAIASASKLSLAPVI
jgi:hypothetical protein